MTWESKSQEVTPVAVGSVLVCTLAFSMLSDRFKILAASPPAARFGPNRPNLPRFYGLRHARVSPVPDRNTVESPQKFRKKVTLSSREDFPSGLPAPKDSLSETR